MLHYPSTVWNHSDNYKSDMLLIIKSTILWVLTKYLLNHLTVATTSQFRNMFSGNQVELVRLLVGYDYDCCQHWRVIASVLACLLSGTSCNKIDMIFKRIFRKSSCLKVWIICLVRYIITATPIKYLRIRSGIVISQSSSFSLLEAVLPLVTQVCKNKIHESTGNYGVLQVQRSYNLISKHTWHGGTCPYTRRTANECLLLPFFLFMGSHLAQFIVLNLSGITTSTYGSICIGKQPTHRNPGRDDNHYNAWYKLKKRSSF